MISPKIISLKNQELQRFGGSIFEGKNNTSFKAGMLLKTKSEKNKPRGDPNIWLKPNHL